MDLHKELPEHVYLAVCKYVVLSADIGRNYLFSLLCSFRCVSKKLSEILDDSTMFVALQRSTIFQPLLEPYIVKKLFSCIKASSIDCYSRFFAQLRNHVTLKWIAKLRKEQLLSVVRHSTVNFLQQYLSFPVPPAVKFTRENIMRAIQVANEREDGNEMLLYLFPIFLRLCFAVSDPQHIQAVIMDFKSGKKLNLNNRLNNLWRKINPKNDGEFINSAELVPLLEPKRSTLIIPEGTLFNVNMTALKHGEYQKIKHGPARIEIRYVDGKAKEHTIEVPKIDEKYTYEEISTSNLYELFVRTSIFSKVFGDFPQQIIAFTEQNVRLDPIDQPWFFGAMSGAEAREILANAGVYPVIITRSIGADIYVTYSSTKRSSEQHHNYRLSMKMQDILTKTDNSYPRFFGAVYNQGVRKNMLVYETYATVVSKPLDQIIKFINDNKIDLTSEIYQQPNMAIEYLTKAPKFDRAIFTYLIAQGAAISETLMGHAVNRNVSLEVILWLINKGAMLYQHTAATIMARHALELEDVKKIVAAVVRLTKQEKELVQVLMENLFEAVLAGKYNVRPTSGKRSRLVRLAWQFGNEDNLFKTLPKELIELICSFLNPDWWDIAEYLSSEASEGITLRTPRFERDQNWFLVFPFIWQYWDRFALRGINNILTQAINTMRQRSAKHPEKTKEMIDWCVKFIMRMQEIRIYSSRTGNELFSFIMENELALPLLDAAMTFDKNLFGYYFNPTSPIFLPDRKLPAITPAIWAAAVLNNRPVLKYLIDKGRLHFNDPANSFARLEDLIKTHGKDSSVLDYIKQLIFDKDPTSTSLQRKI